MSIQASWNAALGAVAGAAENFNRQSFYNEVNESRKATYAARAETAQLNRDLVALRLKRMQQKMDEFNSQPVNSFKGVEEGFEIVHPKELGFTDEEIKKAGEEARATQMNKLNDFTKNQMDEMIKRANIGGTK